MNDIDRLNKKIEELELLLSSTRIELQEVAEQTTNLANIVTFHCESKVHKG